MTGLLFSDSAVHNPHVAAGSEPSLFGMGWPEWRLLAGCVGLVVLGVVAQVHLRRTSTDEEYGLTAGQRRARSGLDGVNVDGLLAAQRKRVRRAARRREVAGRRQGRHRVDGQPPPSPVRWWRRTALHRR